MKWIGLALVAVMAGCGAAEETDGPLILPHVSPVQLGDFWPLGTNSPEPGNNERTPYEWVLLLQSTGDEPVKVSKVCMIGDTTQFILEGPEPSDTIPAGDEGALRLTYGRTSPGSDRAAVVVKSNAKNFPTLIVPVCAAVVADGAEKNKNVQPCEFPESQIPADSELCP